MYCRSYPLLYQAYKVIFTLSVTQVGCKRAFSKLRYVKNRFKKSAKRRSLGFPFLDVRRTRRLLRISNDTIVDEPAKMNVEMRRLLLYKWVFDNVCLLILNIVF